MTATLPAREFVAALVDPGTWVSWDEPVTDPDPLQPSYARTLTTARQNTGLDESIITGAGQIHGHPIAILASEFAFLGGSLGTAAAERLTRAIERATTTGLPLLAAPASGGTRMQEGTIAFLQMAKVSQAVLAHKATGLPYLVYLRHPTTGGVLASWGSLGHLTFAEPGALIGFLGPRVVQALTGTPFPPHTQTAENLHRHGLIDAVIPPEHLPPLITRTLKILPTPTTPTSPQPTPATPPHGHRPGTTDHTTTTAPDGTREGDGHGGGYSEGRGNGHGDGEDRGDGHGDGRAAWRPASVPDEPTAWEVVRRSRRTARPGIRRLLRQTASEVVPMHGTQSGETGTGMMIALARFGQVATVVVGNDRRDESLDPAGLRAARRGLALAADLGLPVVTVVDTAGAALTPAAEEGGLAGEIARCLADMISLPVPTLCVLLGHGSGGASLALLPADRVVAAANGWLSPLPPEGASMILYRTTERAAQIAAEQGIRAQDLYARGVVDRIVAEHPDAADEPAAFLDRLVAVLADELAALLAADPGRRLAARRDRYRAV